MPRIIRTAAAEEDIIDIWFYIAVENKSQLNADRFMKRLDERLEFIARNPGIGMRKDHYSLGLLQLVFDKYLIFYFELEDGIEVVRVLHSARDIRELFA